MSREYKGMDEAYLEQALDIALSHYQEERQHVPQLPLDHEIESKVREQLAYIWKNGDGLMVLE